jgi:UDP-GlcNAc:undecaprenyl-phosphate/decaprenyl-phosphate GlcNAc-1-phosphate transferase
MMAIVCAFLVSLAVGLAALRLLLSERLYGLALERPNERSMHAHAVPRTGGLGLLAGAAAGAVTAPERGTLLVGAVACALGLVSYLDDKRGLPVATRLLTQLLSAATALFIIEAHPSPWLVAAAVLGITWAINLFNFMDGADGLAGGMAVAGFAAYAVAAGLASETSLAALCTAVAGGSLAFLRHNFPPATIFMGDAGSTVLGFLAATLGFYGQTKGCWPAWFPIVVFLPFIFDASLTLLRRALRGERVWKAHREHLYQRVALAGLPKRDMTVRAYALMLTTAGSALLTLLLARDRGPVVLLVWVVLFGCTFKLIDGWIRAREESSAAG